MSNLERLIEEWFPNEWWLLTEDEKRLCIEQLKKTLLDGIDYR